MPESARYLEKARQCLSNARATLNIGLSNDAGRKRLLSRLSCRASFYLRFYRNSSENA